MRIKMLQISIALGTTLTALLSCNVMAKKAIVHDAEYYVLEAQNGKKWSSEDKSLQQRLAELKKKHGTPPNIVHIMWDDTAFGDVGIPCYVPNYIGINPSKYFMTL